MEVVGRVFRPGDHQEKGSKPENMKWFPGDRRGPCGFECEYLVVPLKEIRKKRASD